MFKHGFPPEWSTFKKLIWLVGSGIAGASYIWKTVSGTLIHLTDALASPMQKCEVTLEPIQAGSGDPSPDNVRPITGWTGCEVTRTGKQLINENLKWVRKNNTSIEVPTTFQNGVWSITTDNVGRTAILQIGTFKIGTYTISLSEISGASVSVYAVGDNNRLAIITDSEKFGSFSLQEDKELYLQIDVLANTTLTITKLLLEQGSTASEYEAFNGATASVTFPDTVYGGKYEFVGGARIVDRFKDVITSFSNATDANWNTETTTARSIKLSNRYAKTSTYKLKNAICNMCTAYEAGPLWQATTQENKYGPTYNSYDSLIFRFSNSAFGISSSDDAQTRTNKINAALAVAPLEICCELETAVESQLTPQEISTLKGVNNVWSNTNGDTTIIYKAQAE